MVWKSNITVAANDNNASLEHNTSPRVMDDKENQNRQDDGRNSSIIDARSSENYLQDDVIDI